MRWRVWKNKLNEMNALSERENVKLDKSKRSLCSPVVFKHGCLLESHLEL